MMLRHCAVIIEWCSPSLAETPQHRPLSFQTKRAMSVRFRGKNGLCDFASANAFAE
jgi:hypothetical protein